MVEMSSCENILQYEKEDIKKQVNELKNELADPSNFHKKDLSEKISIMKEDVL